MNTWSPTLNKGMRFTDRLAARRLTVTAVHARTVDYDVTDVDEIKSEAREVSSS